MKYILLLVVVTVLVAQCLSDSHNRASRPRPTDASGNPLTLPTDSSGNPVVKKPKRTRVDSSGNPLPTKSSGKRIYSSTPFPSE